MERAFKEAGEPFDMISYIAEGNNRGRLFHWPDNSKDAILITKPNEYSDLPLGKRPIILKIHGAVMRNVNEPDLYDSYVITEDNYIDYLTHTELSNFVPVTLAAKLRTCNFLFLGYALRDWNLRVILQRISGERNTRYQSWAIQLNPPELDKKFWRNRDVEIHDAPLAEYIEALAKRVRALPRRDSNGFK
jgi:hypothetical protein